MNDYTTKIGRPSLLTLSFIQSIEQHILQGYNIRQSLDRLGVNEGLYYYWLGIARNSATKTYHNVSDEMRELCIQLSDTVKKAQGLVRKHSIAERINQSKRHPEKINALTPDYTEHEMRDHICANLNYYLGQLGLPRYTDYQVEWHLPNKRRVDLLVTHANGEYSIIEVKSIKHYARSGVSERFLYSPIGQLLYYYHIAKDVLKNAKVINLAILADYTHDDYYFAALNSTNPAIKFYDVSGDLIPNG